MPILLLPAGGLKVCWSGRGRSTGRRAAQHCAEAARSHRSTPEATTASMRRPRGGHDAPDRPLSDCGRVKRASTNPRPL